MTMDELQQAFVPQQSVLLPGLFVQRDNVQMIWKNAEGQISIIPLPYDVCATLLNIIDSDGSDHAQKLLMTAARVAHAGESQSEEVAVYNVAQLVQALKDERSKLTNEEHVFLAQSYDHLRSKAWTRARAAAFASTMLGRKISIDTWRKKVDRWADRQGLPKVELYTRRFDETDNAI